MVNLRLPANYFGRQATFMWRDRTAASWQSRVLTGCVIVNGTRSARCSTKSKRRSRFTLPCGTCSANRRGKPVPVSKCPTRVTRAGFCSCRAWLRSGSKTPRAHAHGNGGIRCGCAISPISFARIAAAPSSRRAGPLRRPPVFGAGSPQRRRRRPRRWGGKLVIGAAQRRVLRQVSTGMFLAGPTSRNMTGEITVADAGLRLAGR